MQTARTFAVEAEVLRAGGTDHEGDAGGAQGADGGCVVVKAGAEALIGDVEEGKQVAFLNDPRDLGPLLGVEVVAGRVVAAGVQKHDRAGLEALETGLHGFEVDAVLLLVEVGVAVDLEACVLKKRDVVAPGGVGDDGLCEAEVFVREHCA